MSSVQVFPPFDVFTGTDGLPLESGYIYIGTANLNPEAAPVEVFYDVGLTMPAPQPIRTLGGYPSRAGTPARLYVASSTYSITVKDKNQVVIFSLLNSQTASQLGVDLSGPNGAAMIGFIQAGAGAFLRTLQAKNREIISVTDFGATGDGVTDDAPAFRAAITACPNGGTVIIPPAALNYLMNSSVNNAILDFTGFPNKCITIRGFGWTLKSGGSFSYGPTTGPRGSVIRIGSGIGSTVDFYHQAPTDLTIGGVKFMDFAVTSSTGAYGTSFGRHGFNFDGTAFVEAYFENTLMENVFVDNFATGYSINVASAGNIHGVHAGMVIRNCKLMNINAPGWGDSNTIEYCTIGANATLDSRNVGVYFYNISGATSTRILNNNFVNANGMIICDGGTKPIIDGNEMEQSLTNTLNIMVYMRGNNATIDCPTITNNLIAQNVAGQTYVPIFLNSCQSANVSNNRTSTPTNYPHLEITTTSSFTVVEADNQAWVLNTPQNSMSTLDAGFHSVLRGQAWKTFTPTVSAGSGTFTSVVATGALQLTNSKKLSVRFDINIVDAGTAAGAIGVSMPGAYIADTLQVISGQETAATGRAVIANIVGGSSTFSITGIDGLTIIATGRRVVLTGFIEID